MTRRIDWLNRSNLRNLLVFCLFIVVGTVVFLNSLGNAFHFDDEVVVVFNRNITSLKNIPLFFTHPKMMFADPHLGGHYRPLVVTAYAVSYAIGGLSPVMYHIVNLSFHIGTAFLIFLIVQAMLGNSKQSAVSSLYSRGEKIEDRSKKNENIGHCERSETISQADCFGTKVPRNDNAGIFAAFAAGLIFLVHPFNSEAVDYVTAVSSVMSGFFYLLAFYFWINYRSKKMPVIASEAKQSEKEIASGILFPRNDNRKVFYILSLLAFIAGMLSKEVVITIPIMLWLYDLYFPNIPHSTPTLTLPRQGGGGIFSWRTYSPYIPFILLVVIPYMLMRFFSLGKVLDRFQRDIWTQLFTELPVLVKHWQMFFIPVDLTPLHFVEIYRTYWSFPVLLSTVIIIAYLTTAFILLCVQRLSARIVSFFMFWFFIVLLPTTIIPLNEIFQENRGYLAIVSFAVIAGVIIGELGRSKLKWVAFAILVVVVTAYSGYTFQRNKVWKDDVTLWTDALKKSPRSPEVYTALAIAYRRVGMEARSIDASQKALILGGNGNFYIHDNLGRIYIDQGNWQLAAQEFEMAIKGYRFKADTHNELGIAYFRLDKHDLAEKEFLEAARLDPQFSRPYYNLGVLYSVHGRISDSVSSYKIALAINPVHLKSLLNLGVLMEESGRKTEAAEYYRQVIQLTRADEKEPAQEASRRLGKMRAIKR